MKSVITEAKIYKEHDFDNSKKKGTKFTLLYNDLSYILFSL